jgi:hypothetical protein
MLLALGEIDRYKRDGDAFLSQEDPNLPGIWRRGGMVDFQFVRHKEASFSFPAGTMVGGRSRPDCESCRPTS